MGRTSLKHSVPLVVFLMAVALIGMPFIEFLFVCVVSIGVGAGLFYAFLTFMHGMDRIVEYFYLER